MVKLEDWLQKAKRLTLRALFCGLFVTALLNTQSPLAATAPSEEGGWFVNMGHFAASAHGTFSCEDCHGNMNQGKTMHPDSNAPTFLHADANRLYDYKRCKACHKPSYEQYLSGAHANALKKEQKEPSGKYDKLPESKKAPTCGSCHSAHYTKAHLSRVEMGRQTVSVCAACHPAQAATYLENYHGKAAVNLGDKNAAFCTDCHGAHRCVSLKDKEAALNACRRCHPEAKEGFAQVVIHPTTQDPSEMNNEKRSHVALIRVVTVLMAILAILIVGFFYGHSFVWILRELHERLRKHK